MYAWILEKLLEVGELESNLILSSSIPKPNPTSTQVLVKVLLTPINIDDIHVAENTFLGGIPFTKPSLSKTSPGILGCEGCGRVEKVGKDVQNVQVGDIVWGLFFPFKKTKGSWAQFCCLEEKFTIVKPLNMTVEDFAASAFSLFVACGAFEPVEKDFLSNSKDIINNNNYKNTAMLSNSTRALVIGASGGIGSLICQVLKHKYNAYVIGVCSGRNKEIMLTQHKADEVIDYTKQKYEDVLSAPGKKVDVVFDCIGGLYTEKSAYRVLSKRGAFVTLTGPVKWVGDRKLSSCEFWTMVAGFIWRSIRNFWSKHAYYLSNPSRSTLLTVRDIMASGTISPIVDRVINFDDCEGILKAIEHVRSHRPKGKVLIKWEISEDTMKNTKDSK